MNIPVDISLDRNCRDAGEGCNAERLARWLSALGHPARVAILRRLSGAETCCCKDVVAHMDLAQSTVSQHLKILYDAGLVRRTSRGQRSCYAIDREAIKALSGEFHELIGSCVVDAPNSQD